MRAEGQQSIKKKLLSNSRDLISGTKNLKIYHLATLGDTHIDLTNLVTPSGFTNPSPTEISEMRLNDLSDNWFMVSTLRGEKWIEKASYEVITNNSIKLKSGYEALGGEIFEIHYFNHNINGTVIADVRTAGGTGELLEDQRDFNLGDVVLISDFNNKYPMSVLRGSNAIPMLRNDQNASFVSDHSIGNYEMLDRGDGYCQVIRFNIKGDIDGELIAWANHGAVGERSQASVLNHVDKINGIVDKMRTDLLETTGFDVTEPTRYDQGVPTQSDLMAFGDKVASLQINKHDAFKILWQEKLGNPPSTFNDLEIGKTYKLSLSASFSSDQSVRHLTATHNASVLLKLQIQEAAPTGPSVTFYIGNAITFVASASIITFSASGSTNGRAILEELPNHEITSQWS